jgi:hypothetical protein
VRLTERLRALDNRVLGRPKPDDPRLCRIGFFFGLIGIVSVLETALVRGEPRLLGGIGGLLGLRFVSGLRWALARRVSRPADPAGEHLRTTVHRGARR